MLAVDPDPPNPISSFLRTLTLNDSREPLVLSIIEDTDLDLSDLGLEEVFMTNDEPCHNALDTCKSIKMDGTRHLRKKKKKRVKSPRSVFRRTAHIPNSAISPPC